ncbi:2737_t:CDS:1, partial [Gigaspora rosea]
DYVMLTVKEIINNLQELIDLGFNPTDTVILDILQLNIGERIIQAFISVCKNEK